MPKREYELTVEDKQILDSLKRISKAFSDMEKKGDQAVKRVSDRGVDLGGVMTGVVSRGVTALIGTIVKLGVEAVSVFGKIIVSSQQTAAEFDTTRRKFIGIFEGNEQAADAVMDKIGQRAAKLGLNLNDALSLTRGLLPDVKGLEDPLEQIEKALGAVRGLVQEDPVQGIIGARIAIDEALSGNLRSLRARFEFTKTEIGLMKEAQQELGEVVGTFEGLNRVLKRRGFDIERLKGSYNQAIGEMAFATSKLQIALGTPITDELAAGLNRLLDISKDKGDDLEQVAGAIGDLVAMIVDFLAQNIGDFLEQLDTDQVLEMVNSFQELVNQALIFADVILGLKFDDGFFETITGLSEALGDAVETLTNIVAWIKAATEAATVFLDEISGGINKIKSPLQLLFGEGELGGFGKDLEEFKSFSEASADAQDAFNKSILDSADAMSKGDRRMQEANERMKERIEKQGESTEAGLAEAEALLKTSDTVKGLSEEETKAADALAKATEKRLKLATQFSQKREKIARNHLQRIDDIERDHIRTIDQATDDSNQKEMDLAKKQATARADVERQAGIQLIDIERDFQREIDNISRQLTQDKNEAEEQQNAIAFINAIKRAESAKQEAGVRQTQATQDAGVEFDRRKDALVISQELERQQLEEAETLKLEKLREALQIKLEEERLANERRLEEQTISEGHRLTQVDEALTAEINKLKESGNEKLGILETQLTTENNLIEQKFLERTQILDDFIQKADAAALALTHVTLGAPTARGPLQGRQTGGLIGAGQSFIVGEGGPEIFTPRVSGNITPNNQLRNIPQVSLFGTGATTNNNFNPQFQLSNPAVLSPEQAIATQNIARQMAINIFSELLQRT